MGTSSPDPQILSGRYRLIRSVAKGGMAEIWQASDLQTDAVVAVKRLHMLSVESSTADYRRLLREAEALRDLSHPNIVRYLDVGLDSTNHPFIVLEWLEGEDLAARRARGPVDLNTSLEVVRQALAGLACAHAKGIVHRDIAPRNLFIERGGAKEVRVKLLDFGLARYSESVMTCLTRDGTFVGTLHYMAPEQLKGDIEPDHRVDLYALGVILYKLVTGRLPFDAPEPAMAVLKIISETPPWPTELNPDVPPWVEGVIMRAIMRSPSDRYPSAEEMLQALVEGGAVSGEAAESAAVTPAAGPEPDRAEQAPVDDADAAARQQERPTFRTGETTVEIPALDRPRSPMERRRPPRHVLFGGFFRQWPRLRVMVGFTLALTLGSLVPTAYSGRVMDEQLRPLHRELITAMELESRATSRRAKNIRSSREVARALNELRWRQFLFTLGIWGACFGVLCLLWFKFC